MKTRKLPTLAKLKKIAWKLLSGCIRREAADRLGYVRCYTCDWVGMWTASQAGHAIGGRSGAVLFDESIIRPQCKRCNIFLRGNYGIFASKLIKEHGQEWYDQKQIDSHKTVKFTRSDVLEKTEAYKVRL
mgnify:CR=1 FL=1